MRRLLASFFASVLLLSLSLLTVAQTKNQGEMRQNESGAAGHLLWFMEGRTLPDGSPAAKYVSEAHRQKLALRKANALRMSATRAAGVASVAANASSSWVSIGPSPIADDTFYGPTGGRVDAVAVDPTDATGNTVYIGGAFGGLWRSTNGATPTAANVTWTPLLDQQATLAVGAIAVKPDNGDVILVGTGENKSAIDSYYGLGILRSTDHGATWTRITGDKEGHSFLGLGFGKITFSTVNSNLVVAATGIAARGGVSGLFGSTSAQEGLYYSADAGATWLAATMSDGVLEYAHSVVYNSVEKKFFASVTFHGVYSSPDGSTWTRLANQPNQAQVSLANCPTTYVGTCPFYRGELAVRAGSNDMFVWWASTSSDDTLGDGGVWRSKDGGTTWTGLDMTGVNKCDSPTDPTPQDACGVYQAWFYNMYIGAVANPANSAATDVYLGSGNIFKCTLDATHTTCANTLANPNRWMNLTRAYGCSNIRGTIASVHPDQHNVAFTAGSVAYFVNDGGVYRAKNTGALIDDSCTTTVPFDNLNNYPLSLTQFVWGTPHPTDPEAFLGGAQDVGTSMRTSTTWGATQKLWLPMVVGGDGGYNAFTPNGSVLQSWTDATINICSAGLNCGSAPQASWRALVRPTDVALDDAAFYMPWMLDPRDKTKLILGTCRVWRGSSQTTFAGTALSQKLNDTSGLANCGSVTNTAGSKVTDRSISALAAGGPAAPSGGSSVIYASLSNGAIFRTTDADSLADWTSVTPPASLNPGPFWTPPAFKISALWVEPSVSTGLTVYAAVQGFATPHVLRSTDGGTNWINITGDLPDAPVNSITTDPDDGSIIYVGTDTGVYVSTNNGANWTEVGPNETLGGAYLPNVPVTRVTMFKNATNKYLYAVTYGRGVWRTDVTTPGVAAMTFNPDPVTIGAGVVGGSASHNLTITNTGSGPLVFTRSTSVNAEFAINPAAVNGCAAGSSTVAAGGSCNLSVTFSPLTTGVRTGSVTFLDNTTAGTHTITFTGTGEDFNAPVSDKASASLTAGASGTFAISVAPKDGSFNSAIAFTCTGLPSRAACSFAPATLTPGAATASTTLTVTTARAGNTNVQAQTQGTGVPLFAFWIGLPGMVLLPFAGVRKTRGKVLMISVLFIVAIIMVFSMASCGGGGGASTTVPINTPGTPAGTFTIQVVASSGGVSHSTPITLNVQ